MPPSLTRWQTFYQEDPRLRDQPASLCAQRALEVFQTQKPHTILDLGCGAGRDTRLLAGCGAMLIGLDAAHSGLQLAHQRSPHLPFLQSDSRQLPFAPNSFDAIYCYGLLHEFVGEQAASDVQQTLQEVQRILRPGGTFILAVLAGEPGRGLPHVQFFDEAMFNQACRGLEVLEKQRSDDLSCTGLRGYIVWYAHLVKPPH